VIFPGRTVWLEGSLQKSHDGQGKITKREEKIKKKERSSGPEGEGVKTQARKVGSDTERKKVGRSE